MRSRHAGRLNLFVIGRRFSPGLGLCFPLVILLLFAGAGVLWADMGSPRTTAGEVHLLNPAEAAERQPVRLTGVVTALSGWKNSFFLQDATSGISVNRKSQFPELRAGDRVVVEGVTDPGAFAPQIADAEIRLLGHGKLPQPPYATAADLAWGVRDSQYVAVRGEVRFVEHRQIWGRDHPVLMTNIGAPDLVAIYVYSNAPEINANSLVGATITARGVCGTIWNNHRQFAGLRLFTNSPADIHIDSPPPADPFGVPFREIGGLLQFGRATSGIGQVKIRGTVTAVLPGLGFYLQDSSGGTFVADKVDPAKVGARLEIVGFPSTSNASPMLEAIHLRSLGTGDLKPQIVPNNALFVADRGFVTSPYESTLVELTARLVEYIPGMRGGTFLLQSGDTLFNATLPEASGRTEWKEGSVLRLRGVCIVSSNDDPSANTFQLRLRSIEDITIVKGAPWWTVQHALWLSALLGVFLLAMFAWVAFLRRQARLQALVATDPLTGLYNRRGFLLLAQKQVEVLQRRRAAFLLFYFDVNRFKQINDTHGHRTGDAALRDVAAVLRQVFRDADVLCRLGGDEFAVLATDVNTEAEAILKDRLHDALEHFNRQSGRVYQVSLSVGALFCSQDCLNRPIEDLLEKADALMYTNKRGFQPDVRPLEA